MTDRESFLAACLANPADDTTRLVYADFLREAESPLGRFLWAGVTLAKFRGQVVEDGMFFDAQKELNDTAPTVLASQLKSLFGWEWETLVWDQCDTMADHLTVALLAQGQPGGYRLHAGQAGRTARGQNNSAVIYERGMLTGLRLLLADWREVAAKVLAVCPLERVDILDVPGLTLRVCGPEGGWRLTGELRAPRRARPTGGITVLQAEFEPARTWAIDIPAQPFRFREQFVTAAVSSSDSACAILHARSGDRWPGPPDWL